LELHGTFLRQCKNVEDAYPITFLYVPAQKPCRRWQNFGAGILKSAGVKNERKKRGRKCKHKDLKKINLNLI
jgi:hypothetical protein